MASFPSQATYSLNGTEYSMSDKRPDRGFGTTTQLPVSTFTSQAGYEARRLLSRRSKRTFTLSYTNLSGPYKAAIENFYNARGGTWESFEFDLSYAGQNGIIFVRFDGPLNVTQVLTSLDEINDFYNVTFNLQETFS
jgi:hypothetical protein